MNKPELYNDSHEATYCPEDNKLRLYVGRVPRDEYEALRAEGWTATPKQACNFVATWTPWREETALSYAGIIGDEDQSPADRAADRAERFSQYRENRRADAGELADRYEDGPKLLGYQSEAMATRKAGQLDRVGTRAVDAWQKAEYWQRRTEGVIGHALYVSTPGVRMGRIKELEADIRKQEKDSTEATQKNQLTWDIWNSIAGNAKLIFLGSCGYSLHNADIKPAGEDGKFTAEQCRLGMALMMVGDVHTEYGSDRYKVQKETLTQLASGTLTPEAAALQWLSNHPERPADWNGEGRWLNHYRLRLAYENQMLEAQGGRAAFVEMEAGGWIGSHQVQKVNKSPATGRVVSVAVTVCDHGPYGNWPEARDRLVLLNIERLKSDVYRAPTAEEREAFQTEKKAEKKARAATAPKQPPLVNPTDDDAERLQDIWNRLALADREASYKRNGYSLPVTDCQPQTVLRITQEAYSEASRGTYKRACTREVFRGGVECETYYQALEKMRAQLGEVVCQVRRTRGKETYSGSRVIVLTDKPQKPLPASVWTAAQVETPAAVEEEAATVQGELMLA